MFSSAKCVHFAGTCSKRHEKVNEVITREQIVEALTRVALPGGGKDIVSAGLVSDIAISGDAVMFAINVEASRAREMEPIRLAAQKTVASLPGVSRAVVALTAERPPAPGPQPGPRVQAAQELRKGVPGIRHLIAVASGKGGVGKSTTAVNLALGLKQLGLRVAALDADIYGPSLPKLLGIAGRPQAAEGGRAMKPMQGYGLDVMSMGFLVGEDTPMIWRGPMVMQALVQMLREVAWNDTDVMVVDMPPGTGDVQLTLAQQTPLSGAVIVSTPQDLALIDARKGLNMFRKVSVPVLGIVENMSYFICSKCGERHEIFGHGGAREEARRLGVPFLGEVPLDTRLRERSDSGKPVVATEPGSALAKTYVEIARKVWTAVERGGQIKAPPRIVVEN
jgi:ATP-binding protein involved in chromosome partitioning